MTIDELFKRRVTTAREVLRKPDTNVVAPASGKLAAPTAAYAGATGTVPRFYAAVIEYPLAIDNPAAALPVSQR